MAIGVSRLGRFSHFYLAFSTDQFAQRLVRAMRADLERADRDAGAAGRGLKGHAVELEHREGLALRGRKPGQQRLDIGQGRWRVAFRTIGQVGRQLFPARARPAPPRVVGRDVARDREEPWLERAAGLVGVARLEKRHEDFLVNVLDFVDRDARAQEARNGRANVVEQKAAGVSDRPAAGVPSDARASGPARAARASSIFFILATLPSVIASASFRWTRDGRFQRIRTTRSAACGNKRQPGCAERQFERNTSHRGEFSKSEVLAR